MVANSKTTTHSLFPNIKASSCQQSRSVLLAFYLLIQMYNLLFYPKLTWIPVLIQIYQYYNIQYWSKDNVFILLRTLRNGSSYSANIKKSLSRENLFFYFLQNIDLFFYSQGNSSSVVIKVLMESSSFASSSFAYWRCKFGAHPSPTQ